VHPPLSVLEFTDPACPWAWGSEPTFRRLRSALADQARWRRVYGILFDPAEDDPAPDPAAETAWYQLFVDDVCRHTGAPAARRLEWVCLDSWPASLAATAALAQGVAPAERVLRRLREQTFVRGCPADTETAVLAAVSGIPGLDLDRLTRDLTSTDVLNQVRADRALTRSPGAEVLGPDAPAAAGDSPHPGRAKETPDGFRYALPTVVLEGPAGRAVVPGWRPLGEYLDAVRRVAPEVRLAGRLPSAESALARWRTLTAPDLALLSDDKCPPATALEIRLRHGSLWVHPDERNLDRIYRQLTDSGRGDTVVP
jgi:predicted DsbA family dithiol-disulfide isomerase